MRIRTWLTIVATAILVIAAGLGIALQYDLEWLRVGVFVAAPAGTAVAVMIVKTRHARANRSMEPASIERARDMQARAGAFNDSAVAAAVALALGTFVPDLPAWVLGAALLAAIAVFYWARRGLIELGDNGASRQ